jgi:hypothetical protein
MYNGQTQLAVKNYQQVLKMNPGDPNATRMLKKLNSK